MKKAQALIEVMVGMGIAAALMPAIVTSFFATRGGTVQDNTRLEATARLREAREVLRMIKEAAWSNVATNGTYRLTLTGTLWSISPGTETNLDSQFTRTIELSDAYRDVTGNFALTGILDPSVKHVNITVSWANPFPSSVEADYYLMRFENQTWTQTTEADFTAGIQSGTAISNTLGGEVTLGNGGQALSDWCAPSLSLTTVDLPKSGVANAISAAVGTGSNPNRIVSGTGDNASGVSLGYVTITNSTPPTGSLQGTFDGYKTNEVFVSGNYALMGTDTNNREVVIVDLTNYNPVTGKYALAGYFDAPGNGNGKAVYASGNIGFVTVGSTLYTFNMAGLPDTSSSRPQLGSRALAGTGVKITTNGNYAYVAESTGTKAMEIIQFSADGTTLSTPGYSSISGQTGVDIVLNSTGSRGYLATPQGRVYILNTSAPYTGAIPAPIGVYNTAGMTPRGVTVVTNNRAIVVGTGGSLQYQVIDITSESNPILCTNGGASSGGLAIASGVNGIASVLEEDGDTYSYIITGDASAELKVIQGGGGGGGGTYTNAGSFESSIFNATASAMFNRFDANVATPVDTSVTYQVALTGPVSGSCNGATYTYVGPDKTSSTYFSSSSQLPLGTGVGFTNPGQCLRYKVFMTTGNTNSSPILYDITFNYSP